MSNVVIGIVVVSYIRTEQAIDVRLLQLQHRIRGEILSYLACRISKIGLVLAKF